MSLIKLTGYSGEAEIAGAARRITVDNDGLHIHDVSLEEAGDLLRALQSGELRACQPAGTNVGTMELIFSAHRDVVVERKVEHFDGGKKVGEEVSVKHGCSCGGECKSDKQPSEETPTETTEVSEKLEKLVDAGKVSLEPVDQEPEKTAPKKAAAKSTAKSKKATKQRSVADDLDKEPADSPEPAQASTDDAIDADPVEPAAEQSEAKEEPESKPEPPKADDGSQLFGELLTATTMREVLEIFDKHGISKLTAMKKKAEEFKDNVPLLTNAGAALPVRIERTAKGMGIK